MGTNNSFYDSRNGTGKCAVLFIHGIMGTPKQFDFLIAGIPHDVSYFRLVLAGHGATVREFSLASMSQWKQQVRDAIASLREDGYEKIVAVTHSMGGLLALNAARDIKVDHMLLLNMPLAIWPTFKFLAVPVAVSLNYAPEGDDTFKAAMTCAGVRPGGNIFHYFRSIARFVELLSLMGSTRRMLAEATCPADAYFSKGDEIVALRSAKILKRRPLTRIGLLPTSGHFYYSPSDSHTIASSLASILRDATNNHLR